MSALSSRQTDELNRSILDYLAASNLSTSFEALKHELDLVCFTVHRRGQPQYSATGADSNEFRRTTMPTIPSLKSLDCSRKNGHRSSDYRKRWALSQAGRQEQGVSRGSHDNPLHSMLNDLVRSWT